MVFKQKIWLWPIILIRIFTVQIIFGQRIKLTITIVFRLIFLGYNSWDIFGSVRIRMLTNFIVDLLPLLNFCLSIFKTFLFIKILNTWVGYSHVRRNPIILWKRRLSSLLLLYLIGWITCININTILLQIFYLMYGVADHIIRHLHFTWRNKIWLLLLLWLFYN